MEENNNDDNDNGDYDLSFLTARDCRSNEARQRRKKRKKDRKLNKASENEKAALDKARNQIQVGYEYLGLPRVHEDKEVRDRWSGKSAYPYGLHSFIDFFKETSKQNHIGRNTKRPIKAGELITMFDDESGMEMYTIEGESYQRAGGGEPETIRGHLDNGFGLMSSNMAKKRGKGKPGVNDIIALGARYRYTEQQGSGREKLDVVAKKIGADPDQFWSVMTWAQHAAKHVLRGCTSWGDRVANSLDRQRT